MTKRESTPEYTFIIPVYNGEPFLVDNIRSLQRQTYPHFEAIYVNDGSEDGSERILRRESASDPRIRWYSKPNGGIASAIAYGLERASGDHILLLDQDDVAQPDRLERTAQAFREGAELIMGAYEIVDEHLNPTGKIITLPDHVGPDNILLEQLKRSYILGSALAFRYKHDFAFHPASGGATDYDIALKMMLNGYRFAYIDEVLIRYRVHRRNTSANYRNQQRDMRRVFEQYEPERLAAKLEERGFGKGEICSALGILYLFLDDLPPAEEWLMRAERLLSPAQGRIYDEFCFYFGVLKVKRGDIDGSIREFGELMKRVRNPSVFNNYGCLLVRKGEVRSAERWFRRALAANPEYLDARHNLDLCEKNVTDRDQYRFTARLLRDQLTHTSIIH